MLDDSNGLYRFKKGFSGDFIEFMGEADMTIDKTAKMLVDSAQKIAKKLRG